MVHKEISEKEIEKIAQEFIDNNKEYYREETNQEYEQRIKNDFFENKRLIENNLKNHVKFFCWPWGHRSKQSIEILKKIGVAGFISTKKGTNSFHPDWNMIRRIELRKYTKRKYLLNLLIARNLILGKIYGWIS